MTDKSTESITYSTCTHIELTEVSALWLLKITLANGSEVPDMSLGAKSLWTLPEQKTTQLINTLKTLNKFSKLNQSAGCCRGKQPNYYFPLDLILSKLIHIHGSMLQ